MRHVTKVKACMLKGWTSAGVQASERFDAGTGVVLGGEWPEEGSAELDVECD